ncbi:hypothetical protein [uncultured Methanosphaera sp.]|uniref:hypothetical protein n=1 Tax=uncultured Methanosphaera sp. TaxID=262501 RepID=UPI0025E53348|nr:hypothetical protein [uncultured Methanosphaera sp.]
MDKIIHYSIIDMLSQNNEISVSIRITTKGFPVEEKLEYHNAGKWSEDISTISRVYNDTHIQEQWGNFQSRLLSFLDDGNMRVILDIMGASDEYYSEKYKLKVIVNSLDIS